MKFTFKIIEICIETDGNSVKKEPIVLIPHNEQKRNADYAHTQNQNNSTDQNLFKKDIDAPKKIIYEYNLDQVPAKCRKYVQEAIIKTEQRMGKEIAKLESIIAEQNQIIIEQSRIMIEQSYTIATKTQEIVKLKIIKDKLIERILQLEFEIKKLKQN